MLGACKGLQALPQGGPPDREECSERDLFFINESVLWVPCWARVLLSALLGQIPPKNASLVASVSDRQLCRFVFVYVHNPPHMGNATVFASEAARCTYFFVFYK